MPFQAERYPENWKQISRQVRDDAGDRCEFCGIENGSTKTKSGFRVVLTVAHLDHDTTNNDRANLRALCQKCHLAYDSKHHQANAAATRRRKKQATGQLMIGEAA